jgi:hypothetical protein
VKKKRITVTAHAGYRGEEYPRSFDLDLRKIDITEITGRWTGQDAEGGNRMRFFRVLGSDGAVRLLACDATTGEWYLEEPPAGGIHG